MAEHFAEGTVTLFACALMHKGDPADRPRIQAMLQQASDVYDARGMSFHSAMTRRLLEEPGS